MNDQKPNGITHAVEKIRKNLQEQVAVTVEIPVGVLDMLKRRYKHHDGGTPSLYVLAAISEAVTNQNKKESLILRRRRNEKS